MSLVRGRHAFIAKIDTRFDCGPWERYFLAGEARDPILRVLNPA